MPTIDHATRGRGPRTRGKTVVTDVTDVTDGRDGTDETKKARRGRTSRKRGGPRVATGRVVKAYCDRRIELGLPPADRDSAIGPLAGQCLRLLGLTRVSPVTKKAGHIWDEETLTDAAVAFADTKRFPGYFEEWAREIMARATDTDHELVRDAEAMVSADPGVRVLIEKLTGKRSPLADKRERWTFPTGVASSASAPPPRRA